MRRPRRVPAGRDRAKPPQTGETDHPANAAARHLSARWSRGLCERPSSRTATDRHREPHFSTESSSDRTFNRIAAAIAEGLRWLPSGFGQTNQANIVMDETGAATRLSA
jgi:hypothetical protein